MNPIMKREDGLAREPKDSWGRIPQRHATSCRLMLVSGSLKECRELESDVLTIPGTSP